MPSRTKLTIEDMQKIAQERGGKCISKVYVNTKTHLVWECSKGHQWKTTPSEIRKGSWCPQCARNKQKLTIEEMHLLAAKRDGRCLSSTYVNNRTKLLWECDKGHQWEATPQHIKDGTWCPYCRGNLPLTITEMKQIAKERGGKCLSKEYINNNTKLLWECDKGHQWEAAPSGIKSGTWCPYCAGIIPLTIEEMQEIAKSRGGKCLSTNYINTDTPLFWQCKEGHKWKAVPSSIKRGAWCPYCAGTIPLTIEEMQEIAESRRGKCLSKTYHGNHKHLLWECDKGHQWKATPAHIKYGKWCPYCAGNVPITLEDMQKIAKEKGGECLSKTYVNAHVKLLFKCKEGHQWKTAPAYVKNGSWCPQCAGNLSFTIEDMQKIAESKGGKCLSDTYINANTPLLWECSKGHQWKAVPSSVKNAGTWCPQCGGSFPLTIEKMREMAEERGGKCLSDTYTNSRTHLLWECSEGHQWKAIPSNIQKGQWCPYCKHKYEEICRDYFQALFNAPFLRTRPDWLRNKDDNGLELDGFNEQLKIAFEHQGIQHYELVPHFQKSEEAFEKLQQHDEIKRQLCEKRDILLIEIPQLFLLTNPKDLPLLVKQALEDGNYSIPENFDQLMINSDGTIVNSSTEISVIETMQQLELW